MAPGPTMTRSTFDTMSLDDLWNLHKRVVSILEERLDHEKRKLEQQLEELTRKFGGHLPIQGDADRIRRSSRSFAIPQTRPRHGRAEASSLTGYEIYSQPEEAWTI